MIPSPASNDPVHWISFLRKYGPTKTNENQYDEHIRKSARYFRVEPLTFEHPRQVDVLTAFTGLTPCSVILTGTAGDGKTHLCRQAWAELGGSDREWAATDPHLQMQLRSGRSPARTLHVIRDFSAFAPQRGHVWSAEREALMAKLAQTLVAPQADDDLFLIAANDGQLTEAWHGLLDRYPDARRARATIETLLVEDRQEQPGVPVRLFNLSRGSSDELLQRALQALLAHPAWERCEALAAGPSDFFGPNCPIRENYLRLRDLHTQERLSDLLRLSDHCGVHIPIRQIWLLLSNSLLGHPEAKDGLMTAGDAARFITEGKAYGANIYRNVFGGNLPHRRRDAHLVFEAFRRFGIGYETSNRIDNLLIFGDEEETLREYFNAYLANDPFYGQTDYYEEMRADYIEGVEEEQRSSSFLTHLVDQRQALFFKIRREHEHDLKLWDLTVFRYAGEYLRDLIEPLARRADVSRVVSKLVRGLNRVFTGHLVRDDDLLILASDARSTSSRVSRLLEKKISVSHDRGEEVTIGLVDRVPVLAVHLSDEVGEQFKLNLPRYEFLVRVAEGALPNSFSKEYYEDVLAFKARLLRATERLRITDKRQTGNGIRFEVLTVDPTGHAGQKRVEVRNA